MDKLDKQCKLPPDTSITAFLTRIITKSVKPYKDTTLELISHSVVKPRTTLVLPPNPAAPT